MQGICMKIAEYDVSMALSDYIIVTNYLDIKTLKISGTTTGMWLLKCLA